MSAKNAITREHMYGDPTPEEKSLHRERLQRLIGTIRMLHKLVSHPEIRDRMLAKDLGGRLRQLEESWEQFYHGISNEEAERLEAQFFPNEPGA